MLSLTTQFFGAYVCAFIILVVRSSQKENNIYGHGRKTRAHWRIFSRARKDALPRLTVCVAIYYNFVFLDSYGQKPRESLFFFHRREDVLDNFPRADRARSRYATTYLLLFLTKR